MRDAKENRQKKIGRLKSASQPLEFAGNLVTRAFSLVLGAGLGTRLVRKAIARFQTVKDEVRVFKLWD